MPCSRIPLPRRTRWRRAGSFLYLVADVASHKGSQDSLFADRDAYKGSMVRTAILLAHPVEA